MERMPRKVDELELQEMGSEVLVYNKLRHEPHRLSQVDQGVFARCDGVTPRAEVVQQLDGGSEALSRSLARLRDAGLLGPEVMPQRRPNLIISSFPGELVVFDKCTKQVHHLNQTAATVFSACDGETPVSQVVEDLGREMDRALAEEVLWSSLQQLRGKRLLADAHTSLPGTTSRRGFLSKMGTAAVVLPAILTMLAPLPAQALSCRAMNGPCGGAGGGVDDCCLKGASNGLARKLLVTDISCQLGRCCIQTNILNSCVAPSQGFTENPCCVVGGVPGTCCEVGCAGANRCRRASGAACVGAAQCCSGSCTGGFCDVIGGCAS